MFSEDSVTTFAFATLELRLCCHARCGERKGVFDQKSGRYFMNFPDFLGVSDEGSDTAGYWDDHWCKFNLDFGSFLLVYEFVGRFVGLSPPKIKETNAAKTDLWDKSIFHFFCCPKTGWWFIALVGRCHELPSCPLDMVATLSVEDSFSKEHIYIYTLQTGKSRHIFHFASHQTFVSVTQTEAVSSWWVVAV